MGHLSSGPRVTVVGIGADGHLPPDAMTLVTDADVLIGGERHLALAADVPGQTRLAWPRPLGGLAGLLAPYDGQRVVALASGDPLVSGIATTLIRVLGADAVDVVPAVSSVALARARMGWSAEESAVVSLVGRDVAAVRREVSEGRRLILLSSDETTPALVARHLVETGFGASRIAVLGDLGAATESRTEFVAADGVPAGLPRLNVVAAEVRGFGSDPLLPVSWAPGLPDDAFEHDGQITKRDARASAMARLAPVPGAVLWDIGAGAGSVAIEWLRAHPLTEAVAVEADPDRAARIRGNATHLGVPRLRVVEGRAPEVLVELLAELAGNVPATSASAQSEQQPTASRDGRDRPPRRPNAIFVGGGATAPGLLDLCREVLAPGGRLVVHGVTLETERLLLDAFDQHGGELTRISIEQVGRLGGRFHGWQPARAIVQWAWTKSLTEELR